MAVPTESWRRLPQVHRLAAALSPEIALVWRVEAARAVVARARMALAERPQDADAILAGLAAAAAHEAAVLAAPHLRPVINATGVILHTNLGRAPLPAVVLEHVVRVASSYSTLEYDAERGTRGSRHDHVEALLTALTGAEAAMAVNNNAGAVLLALAALASGGEVLVSRGQLVEIGGAFRIPDVMRQSGARLVEVGATNKTHAADYERAITDATRLVLKVHTSNFRMTGFVDEVDAAPLAALAHAHGLPMMEDLGSGVLVPLLVDGYREPSVQEVVASGVDLVTFSGDKLLGGPQAGLLVGRRDLLRQIREHPLARALRLDKLTLAALEMTLRLYREGRAEDLPLWQMLHQEPAAALRRARRLARRLRPLVGEAVRVAAAVDHAPVGGGALPGVALPTAVLELQSDRRDLAPAMLDRRLQRGIPPVIGRVARDRLLLDLRTVRPDEEQALLLAVAAAAADGFSP